MMIAGFQRDVGGRAARAFARGADRVRFGAIVRGLALGNRAGLSPLEQRVLAEGSDVSGGYTVPDIVAAQFIDRVRNAMVVMRASSPCDCVAVARELRAH